MKLSSKFDDRGYDELIHAMRILENQQVSYGFFDGKTHPEVPDTSIAQIAYWNDQGVKSSTTGQWKIPPRNFMTIAHVITESEMQKYTQRLMQAFIHNGSKGINRDLISIAMDMADNIRESIDTQEYVPLAESTVRQKGGDYILVETGAMFRDAEGRVEKNNG